MVTLDSTIGNGTLSNGNLTNTVSNGIRISTEYKNRGNWYFEVIVGSGTNQKVDIVTTNPILGSGSVNSTTQFYWNNQGNLSGAVKITNFTSPYSENDVLGIALSIDSGDLEFFINGISQGKKYGFLKENFNRNPINVGIGGNSNTSTRTMTINFGATPFRYNVPLGYLPYNSPQKSRLERLLIQSKNKFYSTQGNFFNELTNNSVDNFIKYGYDGIYLTNFVNKRYILKPNENNVGGLFEQNISRRPLFISSNNRLAIKRNNIYYTSMDGKTLTTLTNQSEIQTLGFNSLTFSEEIYNLVGNNPLVVAFSNTTDDIVISTSTDPFTLYDEVQNEMEILLYTDDQTVTQSDTDIDANWTPFDELSGDIELVSWTEEINSRRTLELNASQIQQLVYPTKDISLEGVQGVDSIDLTATNNTKVAISFDSGLTWRSYRNGVWEIVENAGFGMTRSELNALTSSQIAQGKGGSNTIRFSYSLTGDAEADRIVVRVTLQGEERILPNDAYQLNYEAQNKTIIYTLNRNMTLSVNYVDS